MADGEIASFDEFWDHYVAAHTKLGTRVLHFIGVTAAGACIAGGLLTKRRWLLLAAPVVGYGAAWIGHFFVEGNKPASFEHPLWSFRGDLKMWWLTLTGSMQAEVDRVVRKAAGSEERADESPAKDEGAGEAGTGASAPQPVSEVVN